QPGPRTRLCDAVCPATGRMVSEFDWPAEFGSRAQHGAGAVDAAVVSVGGGDSVSRAASKGGFDPDLSKIGFVAAAIAAGSQRPPKPRKTHAVVRRRAD